MNEQVRHNIPPTHNATSGTIFIGCIAQQCQKHWRTNSAYIQYILQCRIQDVKHEQNINSDAEMSSRWQTSRSWVPLALSSRCSPACLSTNGAETPDAAASLSGEPAHLLSSQSFSATWTFCNQQWSSGQSEESNEPNHRCRNTPDTIPNSRWGMRYDIFTW